MGDGPALGRLLAFRLDGWHVMSEHIEFAFGKRLMVQLTTFGRRGDWIEYPHLGNTCLGVVGNQLVPVGSYPDTRKWSFGLHNGIPFRRDWLPCQSLVFSAKRAIGV